MIQKGNHKAHITRKRHAFVRLLFLSLLQFRQRNPLMLASSTSFFTLFALPPILIILIKVLEGIIKPTVFKAELFDELTDIFGKKTEATISTIFVNFQNLPQNRFAAVLGFLFMIFVATTLFDLIKRSIHVLWSVKVGAQKNVLFQIKERVVSLSLIMAGGIIFLLSLAADQSVMVLRHYLNEMNISSFLMVRIVSVLFSVQLVALWFALIFKWLPNAHIGWKPVFTGGLFTSLLFAAGKYILGKILVNGNINALFGTAGSVVLFLLFVFYSALIFYYGAMFTKNYARYSGSPVRLYPQP